MRCGDALSSFWQFFHIESSIQITLHQTEYPPLCSCLWHLLRSCQLWELYGGEAPLMLTSIAKCCHLLTKSFTASEPVRPPLLHAGYFPCRPLTHLSQLGADSVVLLNSSGVKPYGAAGIHFVERHLLWWWTMIGLTHKRKHQACNVRHESHNCMIWQKLNPEIIFFLL